MLLRDESVIDSGEQLAVCAVARRDRHGNVDYARRGPAAGDITGRPARRKALQTTLKVEQNKRELSRPDTVNTIVPIPCAFGRRYEQLVEAALANVALGAPNTPVLSVASRSDQLSYRLVTSLQE
jgi:hypothetical protein